MRRFARPICIAAVAVAGIALALLLWVQHATAPHIFAAAAQAPSADAAMVLGASVYQNGVLSPVLRARADTAAELYASGRVHKILVTGDNGDLSHNEVNPVGKYLLTKGIPKEDIFLDHAGFDTYSSMYRAQAVFGLRSVVIVSQHFHLARAVFIARALGLEASGLEAGNGENFAYNTLREAPATLKALLDLALSRSPKYLGAQFPIAGDGSATWADSTTTPATTSQASTTLH